MENKKIFDTIRIWDNEAETYRKIDDYEIEHLKDGTIMVLGQIIWEYDNGEWYNIGDKFTVQPQLPFLDETDNPIFVGDIMDVGNNGKFVVVLRGVNDFWMIELCEDALLRERDMKYPHECFDVAGKVIGNINEDLETHLQNK